MPHERCADRKTLLLRREVNPGACGATRYISRLTAEGGACRGAGCEPDGRPAGFVYLALYGCTGATRSTTSATLVVAFGESFNYDDAGGPILYARA